MNKFLIAALAAATVLPSAAIARPHVVVVDHHRPVGARFVVGQRVDAGFVARHAVVRNPGRYRLARPGVNGRWLKVGDDAVLVNLRTYRVTSVARNLFR